MLTLVIPFIDTWDITKRCVEKVIENTTEPIELLMIDNGSEENYMSAIKSIVKASLSITQLTIIRNKSNLGVLPTFKQGYEKAAGDVICFIHSDVLIQETGWSQRIQEAFVGNPQLGLMGLFGAVGVGNNGGRVRSQSNILGKEWGRCECHEFAWQHHSEHMTGLSPATILDGVGMFFSRAALKALVESDMFDSHRAPHHFYDRIMPLKLIDKGFKVGTLGIGFDHYSGATANSSDIYNQTAIDWLSDTGNLQEGINPDKQIYDIAEHQFFEEFGNRLPVTVDSNWNYQWTGVR